MTISLGFYLDANLTNLISAPLSFEQAIDGSSGPQIRVVYIGARAMNRKFESEVNPGGDPIIVSVIDNHPGEGQEASSVKLALDPNDLINATSGEALALPATILSGTTNVIPIYIQVEDKQGKVGLDNSLSLMTNSIIEIEIP